MTTTELEAYFGSPIQASEFLGSRLKPFINGVNVLVD